MGSANANHRVALVIGNSQYPGKDAIPTVAQDAKSVAKLLTERNFRVTTTLDRKRDELRLLIQTFIDATPINGTALIYFGGHSMTANDHKDVAQALLLTVDGNRKAIILGELLEQVGTRSAAKSTIILIDSGQGIPPGYDERRGPAGLNAVDKLPDGVSLNFAIKPNTWGDHPGSMAKRLAESKTSELEAWLNEASHWRLSTCEAGAISKPASHVIAPPERLERGKNARDEWVSPHGTVFCWCPETGEQPGFWIGKYESRKSKFPAKPNPTHRNHPAHSLKQRDLAEQLATLTEAEQKAGRLPRAWEYALPSPEQWEYAARAGSEGERYFSTEDNPAKHANFADRALFETGDDLYEYADSAPESNDGFAGLAPVGSFAPNPWGLHDIFGNVWEQTSTGELRGGSWVSPKEYLKAGLRKMPPSHPTKPSEHFPYSSEFVGFRLIIRER
ncbi:MAG: SUMF1/EgtB/PvdO family nonheme iron enzyme [Akkermansiaceae bacterium]|nr:SUMF1/EgtB/PvdO family nonheme iron enzyme [Akkermansiaceae bacterium]